MWLHNSGTLPSKVSSTGSTISVSTLPPGKVVPALAVDGAGRVAAQVWSAAELADDLSDEGVRPVVAGEPEQRQQQGGGVRAGQVRVVGERQASVLGQRREHPSRELIPSRRPRLPAGPRAPAASHPQRPVEGEPAGDVLADEQVRLAQLPHAAAGLPYTRQHAVSDPVGDAPDRGPHVGLELPAGLHVHRDSFDEKAERVMLHLPAGAVAGAHRPGASPARDAGHLPLLGHGSATDRRDRRGSQWVVAELALREGQEAAGAVVGAEQRGDRHRQCGVAQPAVSVVEAAVAGHRLGQ